jgi:hypothetical protein
MQEKAYWNRIEEIFRKFPAPYPILSLIFGALLFIIYLIIIYRFGVDLDESESRTYLILRILLTSILVSYLLTGNQYMLYNMRNIFQNIKFIPGREYHSRDIYSNLKNSYMFSRKFYIVFFGVIIPAVYIDKKAIVDIFMSLWAHIDDLPSIQTNYELLNNIYNLLLNIYADSNLLYAIYDHLVYFLFLYLVVSILWIIYNYSLLLDQIASDPLKDFIEIDLFHADKVGGLGRKSDLIIKLMVYYSIAITLALLCYLSIDLLTDIIFLLLLLLAGVAILVMGLDALQRLFRGRMMKELDDINKKYQYQYEKLNSSFSGKNPPKEDELQSAMRLISVLHNEREEREKVLNENRKIYSYSAIYISIISIIIPLLTLVERLNENSMAQSLLNDLILRFNASI